MRRRPYPGVLNTSFRTDIGSARNEPEPIRRLRDDALELNVASLILGRAEGFARDCRPSVCRRMIIATVRKLSACLELLLIGSGDGGVQPESAGI